MREGKNSNTGENINPNTTVIDVFNTRVPYDEDLWTGPYNDPRGGRNVRIMSFLHRVKSESNPYVSELLRSTSPFLPLVSIQADGYWGCDVREAAAEGGGKGPNLGEWNANKCLNRSPQIWEEVRRRLELDEDN